MLRFHERNSTQGELVFDHLLHVIENLSSSLKNSFALLDAINVPPFSVDYAD